MSCRRSARSGLRSSYTNCPRRPSQSQVVVQLVQKGTGPLKAQGSSPLLHKLVRGREERMPPFDQGSANKAEPSHLSPSLRSREDGTAAYEVKFLVSEA